LKDIQNYHTLIACLSNESKEIFPNNILPNPPLFRDVCSKYCKQLHAKPMLQVKRLEKIIDLMCSFTRFSNKACEIKNYVPEESHNSLAKIEFFGIQVKG